MKDRPLRIAFIHPFLFRYARGIERYIFNLANALSQCGAEVHLVTWNWKPAVQIEEIDSRIQIHRMPTSRYFAAKAVIPFFARHLRQQKYDFVWIGFAGYGEAEALMIRSKQRFGIVFHYPVQQAPHRYREFKRFGLAERATAMVSVSGYVADGVREFFGRDSKVIHHGVDSEQFRPDAEAGREKREELGLRNGPLLLTAAALEERKGIQWVIKALPQVVARFPETTYLVAGEGKFRDELEQLVRDLKLESHVKFLGAQAAVAPFYQAADVSLILSRGEASSLSALESLACEVPVITARRPPFDELINDDCGVLVEEEDSAVVAQAIEMLLADPQKRKAMGARGRAQVQQEFTWPVAAEEYLRVMKHAIA
jgi:glycosyltransferase involved in cell wall biosynthesis